MQHNADELKREVEATLRRRDDKAGLILEVLQTTHLSLKHVPWKRVIESLGEKLSKASQDGLDVSTVNDIVFVRDCLDQAFVQYCALFQMANADWLEQMERLQHANARQKLLHSLSIAGAFSLERWKKHVSGEGRFDEKLRPVVEAIDRSVVSMIHMKPVKESVPILDVQKMLSTESIIPPNLSEDVAGHVHYRRGISAELESIPSKLHVALLSLEKEWTPCFEAAQKIQLLNKDVWGKISKFIDQLGGCDKMLQNDSIVIPRSTVLSSLSQSDHQVSEVLDYLHTLRTSYSRDITTAQGVDAMTNAHKREDVQALLLALMTAAEQNIANDTETRNKERLKSMKRDYMECRTHDLRLTFIREWLGKFAKAMDTASVHCGDAETIVAELRRKRSAVPGDALLTVASGLRDLRDNLDTILAEVVKKLDVMDEEKTSSQTEVRFQSWLKTIMATENAAYALYVMRRLKSDPMNYESLIDSFEREIKQTRALPADYSKDRGVQFNVMEDECIQVIKQEVMNFAAPISAEFQKTILTMCRSVRETLSKEIQRLKQTWKAVSVQLIPRPLEPACPLYGLLKKPIDITDARDQLDSFYTTYRQVRQVLHLPQIEDVAGLTAPDIRFILYEMKTLNTLGDGPVDVSRIWMELHYFYFSCILRSWSKDTN